MGTHWKVIYIWKINSCLIQATLFDATFYCTINPQRSLKLMDCIYGPVYNNLRHVYSVYLNNFIVLSEREEKCLSF